MTIVVAIHGIMTSQISLSWVDRFDAFAATDDLNCRVLKREYRAGPFPLWNVLVKNRLHARGLSNEIMAFGPEHRLCFVAHSNGTDIALKTIKRLATLGKRTDTLVVIGSVLPSDARKSGIEDLIENGHLGKVISYSSVDDEVIMIGRHSFGYGGLGWEGFRGSNNPAIKTRWFPSYGHGTYFHPDHITDTFHRITRDMAIEKIHLHVPLAAPESIGDSQGRPTE